MIVVRNRRGYANNSWKRGHGLILLSKHLHYSGSLVALGEAAVKYSIRPLRTQRQINGQSQHSFLMAERGHALDAAGDPSFRLSA